MTLKFTLIVLTFISIVKCINTEFLSKIVGGDFSRIKDFPHSVFISINCNNKSSSCGASVLNQAILLTAAHCLVNCNKKFVIKAYTGSERKTKGFKSNVISFKIHEDYDDETKAQDIALLRLKDKLQLHKKAQRVAIMRNPPKYKNAVIAGWGWVDSEGTRSDILKHADQQVFNRKVCHDKLRGIPQGTLCAKDFNGVSYPERGDSGSALVVQGFIQIGIVSFKKRKLANDVVVYTNVSFYYDWIVKNAKQLYCNYDSVKRVKHSKQKKKKMWQRSISKGKRKLAYIL